jgi:hypothetical protein
VPSLNAARAKPAHRKSELVGRSDLGKIGRFFDDADVVQLLAEAVHRDGSISAFARRTGLSLTDANKILNERRPVTKALVKALGLRKVYAPE